MKKAWGSDFKNRRAGAAAIEFAIVARSSCCWWSE